MTDEQETAVGYFRSRESLKVSAFAGAGKTSTLVAMAQSDPRSGVYLAFNKAIAAEARDKFPATVDCRTTHSLAFHAVKSEFRSSSKLVDKLTGNAVATVLALEPLGFANFELKPRSFGALVHRCLVRFCQSADAIYAVEHIPISGKLATLKDAELEHLHHAVLTNANRLWNRMIDPRDATPLGHDGYLKLWALTKPVIARDFILLDEAQDTNDVVLDVLTRQTAQLIYVGDTHQQIYEWRGAVNAMQRIPTKNHSHLTMSFRFGDTIAEAANRILRSLGEQRQIRGNPNKVSEIGTTSFDASLSRTNATVVSEFIRLLGSGKRVHIVGGVTEIMRLLDGVLSLQANKPCDVPELFGYTNWDEVLATVQAEEGHELTTFVNLVQRFTAQKLISAVRKAHSDERSADAILSTVHKAKGREWNRVKLTDDFLISRKKTADGTKKIVAHEELRIAYVAMTRAKEAIYVPPGIRSAFGIQQDPRFDAEHHKDVCLNNESLSDPPPASRRPAPSQQTATTPSHSSSGNGSATGWLDKVRSWFR